MDLFAPDDLCVPRTLFDGVVSPAAERPLNDYITASLEVRPDSIRAASTNNGVTQNYLVEVGPRVLFVKTSDDAEALARFTLEAERCRKLLAGGAPVPTLAAPARSHAGTVFLAFDFLDGEHFTGKEGQIEPAASAFHRLTTVANDVLAVPDAAEPASPDHARLLDALPSLWERGRADARTRAVCEPYTAAFEKSLQSVLPTVADLERDVRRVHTDYHPLNLLFDGSRLVAILDFEDFRIYPVPLASGFAAFKLLRRVAVARKGPLAGAGETWLRATGGGEIKTLADGARVRTLTLLHLILDEVLDQDRTRHVRDLEKHSRALVEIDLVFSA